MPSNINQFPETLSQDFSLASGRDVPTEEMFALHSSEWTEGPKDTAENSATNRAFLSANAAEKAVDGDREPKPGVALPEATATDIREYFRELNARKEKDSEPELPGATNPAPDPDADSAPNEPATNWEYRQEYGEGEFFK